MHLLNGQYIAISDVGKFNFKPRNYFAGNGIADSTKCFSCYGRRTIYVFIYLIEGG
jgi:hypothetical protein